MKESVCIYDHDFKNLSHEFRNHVMLRNGQELEKGYKPDYVLADNNHYVILECENSSSRKTFIGGMIKAAHFLQGKSGILVFVVVERKNTTIKSIAEHLVKYYEWIKDRTGLRQIYVISTDDYYDGEIVLPIESDGFLEKAIAVKKNCVNV